ncbi:MAG: Gfo/Idh/MocA family oxidoreductase [Candidatus Dormiibacterota bacterium]
MPEGRAGGLKVAIVGYGLAGRVFHGPLIRATPGMRVDTIVTANPERQAQARHDHPEAAILPAPDDLWSHARPCDLVVIATPSGSHGAVAGSAIDAGIAVIVEKPLATSAASGRALAAQSAARKVPIVPFFNRRWDSDHLTLSDLLAEGRLGNVLSYESRFERWRPTPSGGWREAGGSEMGGGILLDLGVHLIDQATFLFGPVDTVYAEVRSHRGGADDDVFLALHHGNGVRSHLWASALSAAPGPRLRVLGDRAAYIVDRLDGQEDALRAGVLPDPQRTGLEPRDRWGRLLRGDASEPVPGIPGRWVDFYAGMISALRSGGTLPVDIADAVRGLEIIDAARESAATQSVVAVRSFETE